MDLESCPEEAKPELAIEIIALATKITREDALRWVNSFGNPISDPIASSLFSLVLGLNPEVIEQTCLASDSDGDVLEDRGLAVAMTRLILQALIVFQAHAYLPN
jgi:hypothetical protein